MTRDTIVGEQMSPREQMVLFMGQVFELAGALRRTGEDIARRVGQTQARWQALGVASVGGLTVPAIARRLGVSRQAVQSIVDALVADGLMLLEDNPAHRRSRVVSLTPEGEVVLTALDAAAAPANDAAAAAVGADDLAAARRAMTTLLGAVADIVSASQASRTR